MVNLRLLISQTHAQNRLYAVCNWWPDERNNLRSSCQFCSLHRINHCDIRRSTCRFEQHVVLRHRFGHYTCWIHTLCRFVGKQEKDVIVRIEEMFAIVRKTMRIPSPIFVHLLTVKESNTAATRLHFNGAIIFFFACLNVYKRAKKLNLEIFLKNILMDIG